MTDNKHDQAIELTEQALEKLTEHNEKAADKLLEEAKKLDKTALIEVVNDLDEDANSRS